MSQPKTLSQRITHLLNSAQAMSPTLVACAVISLNKDGECQVRFEAGNQLELLLLAKVFELQVSSQFKVEKKEGL